MRDRVLRQKRRLQADFGADPFAFRVRSVWRVVAASTAAELGAEVGALNLIKLLDFAPGGVADGARNIDLQSRTDIGSYFPTESQRKLECLCGDSFRG